MARFKEIKSRIQKYYPDLPKNHKKLADFFINNFDKIPFYSVQDISEATRTSVASVVRFAQRIGFLGFLEMREEISKELQNHISNKEIFSLLDSTATEDDTLTIIANQDIKNINETLTQIDRDYFDSTIKMILKAKRVYTVGLGVSNLLAQMLAYQLNQVSIDAYALSHSHSTFLEQLIFLNSSDLIIALSFMPYSIETIDAAKYAKKKKIKVISITNSNASPITFSSNANLVVKSENLLFTNSFAAISVLINAITTECALRNKTKAKKMLSELNKIAEMQGMVIVDSHSEN
ncbi:MAG: MurR/RpiR family transcriptional regulator [Ignavibacteriaceae bacterium]|jgi:DNA-binding MurR/RpiR family transcriptional regulator|nr:MurR/RpiR family transcriptional regulator [Ignavibacteriaceae bacterium]